MGQLGTATSPGDHAGDRRPASPAHNLLLHPGPVNNLVGDGGVAHVVGGTDAQGLIPGHLATKGPASQIHQAVTPERPSGSPHLWDTRQIGHSSPTGGDREGRAAGEG